MLSDLKVINLTKTFDLASFACGNYFVLSTCQRCLVVGFNQKMILTAKTDPRSDIYQGDQAYQFLLEVICGLRSKLIGESEIVGQFKQSYAEFVNHPQKNPLVLEVINKLFQDSKKIRSKFLTHIGQQSYAGITKKLLNLSQTYNDVLLFGSGSLSRDLLKVLTKKYNVHLCARNDHKAAELQEKFHIKLLNWENRKYWTSFSNVINTIGAPNQVLFSKEEFNIWRNDNNTKRLFIDLGFPSVVQTPLTTNDGLYRLEDIFGKGVILDQLKNNKIALAKEEITKLVIKRQRSFYLQIPFGWEELKFA